MKTAKTLPPLLNDLDRDDPYFMDRPLGECVACVCGELGLEPEPDLIRELDEDVFGVNLAPPPGSPRRLIERARRIGPPPCLRFLADEAAGLIDQHSLQ